ncbi:MAG: hypothetical protein LUO93_00700 [Methanomicrobiales archaeon]|nr:hypothetical protein [Methanomicrobiales archaeon]
MKYIWICERCFDLVKPMEESTKGGLGETACKSCGADTIDGNRRPSGHYVLDGDYEKKRAGVKHV